MITSLSSSMLIASYIHDIRILVIEFFIVSRDYVFSLTH